GNLDSRTRVGATVDVDGDRHVKLGVDVLEPAFQLWRQRLCPDPSFGERQFAILDPGASHQVSPPVGGTSVQAKPFQAGDRLVEFVVGNVEDDQLLVGGEADPVRTG